jgi:hypothetical protein
MAIDRSKHLRYPSKSFMREARRALDGSDDVQVDILPGWRTRLLGKTLACWPRELDDNQRLHTVSRFHFSLASYLLFSLFHTHVYALTLGRAMSYTSSGDAVTIRYGNRKRHQPTGTNDAGVKS